ncbi:7696_t:CDS:2 [Dentiscutata heterogama]|uniref:7696_t:CDS:1 n=1 Tax=Dentiscutata heterogama TaxID=1316150 RepID=A0ACA9K639_9GLOM|nr:7696_t:CDS:2 [Dentiscutata heterogama]
MTQSAELNPSSNASINVHDFRSPPIPDNDGLEQAVETALIHLEQCANENVKDTIIPKHIKNIVELARQFRSLTQDSINHCGKMAAYASDFMEYVQVLFDEDVSGNDFVEAMKSQVQAASSNRSNAAKLTKGYCDIMASLKNVLNELEDLSGVEKKLEQDVQEAKKEQFQHMIAAVGTGIGTGIAICAAPFTAGASLAVVGALGVASAGSMIGTSITSVQFGDKAKLTETQLTQIEDAKMHLECVMAALITMVDKFSCFEEFFRQEVDDISKVTEKYKDNINGNFFRMSRIISTSMKQQWTKVQNVFDSYVNHLKPLLSKCVI